MSFYNQKPQFKNHTASLACLPQARWIKPDGAIKRNFERGEFENRLRKLGINIPWPVPENK